MDSYPHTSLLTCTLCSCHFKDPRFLPCHHTFCFVCLKTLCDSAVAAASDATKAKIFCPLCKVQATVPNNGADGFQIDQKTQALKDKIVQEIVDNITRSMSNSQESTTSSRFSTSATNNSTSFNGRDRERPSRFSGQSDFSSGASKTSYGGTASGNNSGSENDSYSSIYNGYGKYAKYFESADKEASNGANFKPTIRPDHTRLGYESSIRFRNKQMNSKDHDEERDLRRRTWYGSTLHSRRTQSLNRSTYGNIDESNVRSSENLFKINEDREHAPTSEDSSMSHDQATPQRFKDSSFNTPRMTSHGLNTSTPINSDTLKSDSYHSAIFETPNSSDRSGEKPFFSSLGSENRRSNLAAGPTRRTLPTHRENITTDGPFVRQNSKDRKSSKSSNKSPEHKISFRTRKQSPKGSNSSGSSSGSFREKKTKSPLPSPRRRRKSSDKSPSYEATNLPESEAADARKSRENENRFYRETPTRPRYQQNEPTSPTFHQENISQKMRERINPERRAKTARDRLSFNFDLGSKDENLKSPHQPQQPDYQQHQPPEHPQRNFSENYDHFHHRQQAGQHFYPEREYQPAQPSERISRASRLEQQSQQQSQQQSHKGDHRPSRRKPRCNSVGAQFSLNKNDFKTDQDFKEHLLGMTMTKDQYDRIMDDVRNERDRLDSTGSHHNDELNEEEDDVGRDGNVGGEDAKSGFHSNDDADLGDDKENVKTTLKIDENEADQKPDPPRKHEPLLDENLLSSFRTKYLSALEVKRFPNQSTFPELSEEMTKCWSCQKNDFGVPTAAAFLKTNSLVVADFGLSCLEFFDPAGHLEHTLTGIKPFGVTSYNDGGSIIVGDRKSKSLRIFDEFGADVSQIDNLGSLEWLSGLAVSRDGNLIMSDRSRCKIIISNIGGEVISEFGSYGSGAKQLCMADFFTVDTKNRIIVCDSGNHCLKIFDSNGNPISTVGSRGNSDGLFEWPKGVAVDDNDNILVADTMNHRVSLFSPDGAFIKHLLTSIPDPYNLTWSNNHLAVLHYNLKGMSQYDVYNYKYCQM